MYDENDGFFDHVPPPAPPLTRDRGISTAPTALEADPATGQPYGLGCRVPMTVISPWSRGGYVCSQTFDHTSIIRFIEARFGVMCENITPWRRTVAGDLTSAFDFTRHDARAPKGIGIDAARSLPDQAAFDRFKAATLQKPKPVAPADPPPVAIEPGTRPARPLPYRFAVEESWSGEGLTLAMRNSGPVGVTFIVYDRLNPAVPPRHYTVGAGLTVKDIWRDPRGCDLVVHGPGGYVRGYKKA